MIIQHTSCANLLLRSLDPEDFAWLAPQVERVPLNTDHVIVDRGEPITFVCFPECGVTSLVDVLEDGTEVEVAVVGSEGMTNSSLLLGSHEAAFKAVVRVGGGSSLRLWAEPLRTLCERSPAARSLFLRFLQTVDAQITSTLVSNLRSSVEQRLARWLLMFHDRIAGNDIRLTHDQIARILGARRATITDALHLIEGEHGIRSSRNRIEIRDRAALEMRAGAVYGAAEQLYGKLIAPCRKPPHAQPPLVPLRHFVGA
jgi:CRP-like cAMP-binding protein